MKNYDYAFLLPDTVVTARRKTPKQVDFSNIFMDFLQNLEFKKILSQLFNKSLEDYSNKVNNEEKENSFLTYKPNRYNDTY